MMSEEIFKKESEKFLNLLYFLQNDTIKKDFFDYLISPLERAVDKNFYDDDSRISEIFNGAVEGFAGNSQYSEGEVKTLVLVAKLYCKSPFGLFSIITDLDFSDFFITHDSISCTALNSDKPKKIKIEPSLLKMFHEVVEAFRYITISASNTAEDKFDPAHAILDYAVGEMRFNVAHGSLNASGHESTIIAIRKQLIRNTSKKDGLSIDSSYINSIGATSIEIEVLKKIAQKGSFLIFGETGSGKTTLLKYMGSYQLEKKRNLITIEDTPELLLSNDIAYQTNKKYSIRDLFKVSLRENPSHVLVGETRSQEIVDILESALVFSVGTTLHADSFRKVLARILFLIKSADTSYSSFDINSLILATIDCFVYMKERKVEGVWVRKPEEEIEGIDVNNDLLQCYQNLRN